MNIDRIKNSIRQKIFDYAPAKQEQALRIIERIKAQQGFSNDYKRNSVILSTD